MTTNTMLMVAGRTPIRALALLCAAFTALSISACGGGGGGGASADVIGRILLVTTGLPPSPGATVAVSGKNVVSGIDGTFTLRGVSATALLLTASAAGVRPLSQPLGALKANAVNDLGDIYLSDTGYTSVATGRAVRADTLAPILGAKVRISGQTVVTLADGKFKITGLPEGVGGPSGPVGLIVATGLEDKGMIIDPPLGPSPPDNALGDVLVSPPVGGVPGGPTNIRGTITLTGSTLLAGTVVSLVNRTTGDPLGSVTTGTTGTYGFWVVAGEYTVRAERAGFVTKTQDVSLPRPDVPVTLDMLLVP